MHPGVGDDLVKGAVGVVVHAVRRAGAGGVFDPLLRRRDIRPALAECPITPIMSYAFCCNINDLAFVWYQDTAIFTAGDRKRPPEGGP